MSSISTSPAPSQNSPGLDEALQFIEAIHPNPSEACQIEIRFIDKDSGKSNSRFFVAVDQAIVEINNLFARHQVFIGIASRRGKRGRAVDLVDTNAICVDLDVGKNDPDKGYATVEEALRALADFPLQPSIVVRSGSGVHAYWLLDKPFPLTSASDWSRYQAAAKGLARALRGDNTHDPARTMRTPGTLNFKGAPTLARLSELRLDRRYPFSAFLPRSVSADPEPEPKAKRGGRGRKSGQATLPQHATTHDLPACDEKSRSAAQQALEFAGRRGLENELCEKILVGASSDRSGLDFHVICRLFEIGAESAIRAIFSHYPVGAKYWQKGEPYLERTIERARTRVEKELRRSYQNSSATEDGRLNASMPPGDSPALSGPIAGNSDSPLGGAGAVEMFLSHKALHAGTYLPVQSLEAALDGIQAAKIRPGRRLLIASADEINLGERFAARSGANCDCWKTAPALQHNGYGAFEPWSSTSSCEKFRDGKCKYYAQCHERGPILSVPSHLLNFKSEFVQDVSFVLLAAPSASPRRITWALSELNVSDPKPSKTIAAVLQVVGSVKGELEGTHLLELLAGSLPPSIANSLPSETDDARPAMDLIAQGVVPPKNLGLLNWAIRSDAQDYLSHKLPWRLVIVNHPGADPLIQVRLFHESAGLRWLKEKCVMVLEELMPSWADRLDSLGLSNFWEAPDTGTRELLLGFERLELLGKPATMRALAREAGPHVEAVRDRKDELALRLNARWVGEGRGRPGLRLVRC
jgi:hypothetical protein